MSELHSLQSLPQGMWGGGLVPPRDIVIGPFKCAEQNGNLKIMIRYGKKWKELSNMCHGIDILSYINNINFFPIQNVLSLSNLLLFLSINHLEKLLAA